MMIRLGGGILPTESRNATVIGIFFDDNVDASTFYTSSGSSYSIGCSTGSCVYYPNLGINNARNDIWHTNKAVYFSNIPPVQNEFNMLVPVTPSSNRNPPTTLTVAFFTQNYSIADATGLLKTVSVYRLFGPIVTSSISGAISSVNGITKLGGTSSNFDYNYVTYNWFGYALNTTNINSNPPNNTFTYGSGYNPAYGTTYGGGITITSFYYNIFGSSTLAFQSPPANTATTCTIFGYIYNEIDSPGTNTQRNKKWVYTVFCPIDGSINLASTDGNINFINPQYPNSFTNNFPLYPVLSYAQSDPQGHLVNYIL